MENEELQFPPDMTKEEAMFLEIVKQKMLEKLDDRRKFIFLYCIELGHDQRMAAEILNVHETNISRHLRRIREILGEFRTVKNRE
jgi:DNA-directed RNA polymerase specialized sigma24 family protein